MLLSEEYNKKLYQCYMLIVLIDSIYKNMCELRQMLYKIQNKNLI